MILTCKNYNSVVWPIFGLHNKNIFYDDAKIIAYNDRLIDDKSVEGESLARRRLMSENAELYNFKTVNRNFMELIRNKDCPLYFDNTGRMLVYKRTVFAKVVPAIIEKIGDYTVWLEGTSYSIVVPILPPPDTRHCEAIELNNYPIGIYSYDYSTKARKKFI